MDDLFTDELVEDGFTLILVSSLYFSTYLMVELASGPPPGGHIEIHVTYPSDAPIDAAPTRGEDDAKRIPRIANQAPRRFTVKATNGHALWIRVSDKDGKTQPGRFRVIPVGI